METGGEHKRVRGPSLRPLVRTEKEKRLVYRSICYVGPVKLCLTDTKSKRGDEVLKVSDELYHQFSCLGSRCDGSRLRIKMMNGRHTKPIPRITRQSNMRRYFTPASVRQYS